MMDSDLLIRCEGLGKKFCINQRKSMLYGGMDVFRSMIGFPGRREALRKHEIWALRDINFEIRRGETLGIVGINGAGKSTLLRVLSGIYPPDVGRVCVRGPIGALIAAGAGFHPDMTGRENIYLNGAIVGLKKKEIDRKLDEIIEFAEIGEFIDTPVRFYSSGMYVRLGFSIAANIRPRILLIDEVLSVGDLTFQNKCFRKLKELRESVEAVLFVSHNLDHIRNICSDLIILDGGKVMYHGEVKEGILLYQARANQIKQKSMEAELNRAVLPGAFTSGVELQNIRICGSSGEGDGEIMCGDDLVLLVKFKTEKAISKPQFSVGIMDERNMDVLWQMDHDSDDRFKELDPGCYQLKVTFERPPLVGGVYRVNFAIRDADTCELLTKHMRYSSFMIRGLKFSRAIVNCESDWELKKDE